MKKSKRLLSLLLALTMVLSLMGNVTVSAWADDPQTTITEGGNGVSDPDKNTDPVDNGGANPTENGKDGANPTENGKDDANTTGGENKQQEGQQEGQETNGDETPAAVAVPTRKEGYPAETSATVMTGTAYLLSDLQAGKIFAPAEGQTLNVTNYYYEQSADGGQNWSAKHDFAEALSGTTIQITEMAAGTYMYRFYASHDGVNFSEDTWTLTLTVEDNPTMEFSFFVGKDYTGGYPVIKLYNVDTDDDGNETLGAEITDAFLYSNFTSTLPEGEEQYDPAMGKLVNNYQMFYAKLAAGRYAYRAFAKNADTGAYDVALGGMTLDLPTDKNVDGGAGGGNSIYLQCYSYYVNSKKTNNTYFTADEYHIRVVCPIMKCDTVMGDAYKKGNYFYYPTVLYAAGNACLYNLYAYPDIEGYMFTQTINQTYKASSNAGSKYLTIGTEITLKVTVPQNSTFGMYFQWNNFNTTEVTPVDSWKDNGDGTKSAEYAISKDNGNYTWRLSDDTHVTQAGWLAGQSKTGELKLSFAGDAPTDRVSHDSSKLGTQVTTRDEADLQVNLDPSGFESPAGTTRVRAYRHWELINSDTANIMVEPDFHWKNLSGDATIATVNGGNANANWADITPGTQDSIIAVYYDSVDVNHGSYGSHGGLFPATNPERVGVMVVGGTGVQHGTADADVDFNMAAGAKLTRSEDWDYNYDTWFYGANETNPALDFAVKATGGVTVEYAIVTTTSGMNSTVSKFDPVTAGADGRYTVPLSGFNTAGTNGGTVIIKMTDSTGVSYRLVRVAKVTVKSENISNPGERIMPGDQVKLSFDGMYRIVNKISGIFNPLQFAPTYYDASENAYKGSLGQYQKMDNTSFTVTIPEAVTFADGASTTEFTLTDGYTFGTMFAAANPFSTLYEMTDTGVGTNFNAVMVSYYISHYADAVITVYQKATYSVKLDIVDESGKTVEGATVTLADRNGKTVALNEDGTYNLGYGPYTYKLVKNGYVVTRGSFTLGSADAAKVNNGVLTIKTAAMPKAGANPWDGKTKTEPQKDANGVYQIGTGAELAWFAANGSSANAKLTADIDLAGFDWTPLNKFYGTFDGNGHWIKNLYINSTSYPVGLFGYVKTGAKVMNLGVTGNVTTTNASYGQSGGIAGYLEDKALIANCYSAVNVTGKYGGGIAGYTAGGASIINCYASGDIATTSKNECYLGGICGSNSSYTNGATLKNCYSIGDVIGTSGNASYLGGLSPSNKDANYEGNCFYLEGTVTKKSPKYGITGKGTAVSVAEMRGAIKANDHPFKDQMLAALAVREQELADQAAAAAVIAKINAIGEVTLDSESKIQAARAAYDALSDAQKLLVDNYKTLTAAETKLAQLKKDAADQAAAKAVEDQINAIGKVDQDSKAKINAAKEALEALTTEQKALVSAAAKQTLADAEAALAAAEKIGAIGTVSKDSKEKIDEAKKAYGDLTDAQKELLTDAVKKTLTDAEARYTQLTQPKPSQGTGGGFGNSSTKKDDAKKNDAKTDDTTKSANTGDDSQLTLWLGGAVLSAAALVIISRKRRENA